MEPEKTYREINRDSWNSRVDAHLKSEFYAVDAFRRGATSLKEIELNLIGDVRGKSVLHLQCHFGQDTLSMARMGAKCIGVDLSDKAIEVAVKLNEELGLNARFVNCDVFDAPDRINEKFDMVFVTYGTIGWLPDIERWARVVSHFLKDGGRLVFVEFHPVVWMFDDDFSEVKYPYFKSDPIVEGEEGTYADRDADFSTKTVTWNHGLSEVVSALIDAGMSIELFHEYDFSPYDCFRHTEEFEPGKFRIKHLGNRIPMVYSLVAKK